MAKSQWNLSSGDDLTITLSGYRARHSPLPIVTQSQAATVASFYEPKPNAALSFSAVLCQVSFGLPRLCLPSGAHINAVLGCLFGSILRMWIWALYFWYFVFSPYIMPVTCEAYYCLYCLATEKSGRYRKMPSSEDIKDLTHQCLPLMQIFTGLWVIII